MSPDDMGSVIEPEDMGSEDIAPPVIDPEVMAALVIGVVEPAEDAADPEDPQATNAMASTPPAAAMEIFLSNMS